MLSAIVITCNEEKNITRCLKSLRFADEIIVIDSGSTDKTMVLAKQLGAKVIFHPWPGYGLQKNFAVSQTRGDWLFFIDADEEVSPDLADKIKSITGSPPNNNFDIYWLRIVTIFLGRPLHHLYGHNPRLFKKSAAAWTNAKIHEQVIRPNLAPVKLGDPDTGLITRPLYHHSHPTISSYLKKMHHYTSLDAAEMKSSGHHRLGPPVKPVWWLPAFLAARQFVKLLIYRRGLLDGHPGFLWCLLSSYYEWEMGHKYLKLCA